MTRASILLTALVAACGTITEPSTTPARPPVLNACETDSECEDSVWTLVTAGDIAGISTTLYRDEATARIIQSVIDSGYPDVHVAVLGDAAYPNNLPKNVAAFASSWGKFKSRMWWTWGNHDVYGDTTGTPWYDYLNGVGVDSGIAGKRGKGYQAFEYKGWQLLFPNTELERGGAGLTPNQKKAKGAAEQATWAEGWLTGHPGKCQMAFTHRPVYSSSINEAGYFKPVHKVLAKHHVEITWAGHVHGVQIEQPLNGLGVIDPLGTRTFIVGTGGENEAATWGTIEPFDIDHFNGIGVMVAEVSPTAVHYGWRDSLGVVRDTGTVTCR
jgi:calcineurin-like phosphoesterase family protein